MSPGWPHCAHKHPAFSCQEPKPLHRGHLRRPPTSFQGETLVQSKQEHRAGDFLALTTTQWGCVLFAHLMDKKTELTLGDQSTHLESNSYWRAELGLSLHQFGYETPANISHNSACLSAHSWWSSLRAPCNYNISVFCLTTEPGEITAVSAALLMVNQDQWPPHCFSFCTSRDSFLSLKAQGFPWWRNIPYRKILRKLSYFWLTSAPSPD